MKKKEITEDCDEQEEYCFTTYSDHEILVEKVLCQRSKKLNCNETSSPQYVEANLSKKNQVKAKKTTTTSKNV